MKNILLQLYNGEIFPAEQYIPKITEYQNMRKEYRQNYQDFIKKIESIEPQLKEQFIKILDEQLNFFPLDTSEMFIEGFRLGARMMIEIFQNDVSDMEK